MGWVTSAWTPTPLHESIANGWWVAIACMMAPPWGKLQSHERLLACMIVSPTAGELQSPAWWSPWGELQSHAWMPTRLHDSTANGWWVAIAIASLRNSLGLDDATTLKSPDENVFSVNACKYSPPQRDCRSSWSQEHQTPARGLCVGDCQLRSAHKQADAYANKSKKQRASLSLSVSLLLCSLLNFCLYRIQSIPQCLCLACIICTHQGHEYKLTDRQTDRQTCRCSRFLSCLQICTWKYTYSYLHTYIHTSDIHTYIYIYILCIRLCIHVRIKINTYVDIYTSVDISTHICMNTHVYILTSIYIHEWMHVYKYIQVYM